MPRSKVSLDGNNTGRELNSFYEHIFAMVEKPPLYGPPGADPARVPQEKEKEVSYVAGIDPGINGGIALLSRDGELFGHMAMPTRPGHGKSLEVNIRGVKDFLYTWYPGSPMRVFIELVTPVHGSSLKSCWSFARNFQCLITLCELEGLSFELVPPKVWQKIHEGRYKGKATSIAMANQLFPSLNSQHDGICDAVCIAEWGRRNFSKNPVQPLATASKSSVE